MLRLRNLNPYERHKLIINEYILNQPGSTKLLQRDTSRDKWDIDVIRENHRFLWDEDEEPVDTWEKQLAKKYYDKLFKEYCISDLSRYKENKIALRWRTEKEVISGKGQFDCGNKICSETEGLRSWEVNFAYMEQGEKKNALVKLRLCPDCSDKLNYHSKKREIKRVKRLKKQEKKRTKSGKGSSESLSGDDETAGMTIEGDDDVGCPEREEDSESGQKAGKVNQAGQSLKSKEPDKIKFQQYLDDLLF